MKPSTNKTVKIEINKNMIQISETFKILYGIFFDVK